MNTQKKWTSFDEMYLDLRNDPKFKKEAMVSNVNQVLSIVKDAETASTSKVFFDLTCKLSSIFESIGVVDIDKFYSDTNIYVLILNAVFRNEHFLNALFDLLDKKVSLSDLREDSLSKEKMILLNTAISLAFFGIALNYKNLRKDNVEFLRKNLTSLIKYSLRNRNNLSFSLINICSFLYRMAWDNRLHFNENHASKFPVKLNDKYLFKNLVNSRALAGIALTSLLIRPTIEAHFKKIITKINDPDFSLSFALNSIFETTNDLDERIKHFYRTSSSDLAGFFKIFIQHNERNLIFCLNNFCKGFSYDKNRRLPSRIVEKLNTVSNLKKDYIEYAKANFKAFNSELNEYDDEWTHKLFLISIKTLSLLDEIKDARDTNWVIGVTIRELHQWLVEVHEILNKYYIEDDWEKIKEFIRQENEKIEWKSSFFTPLEQVFISEEADAGIGKQIFEKILKVILAMMNTEGGTLLIGVVENPNSIKRVELKEQMMTKNGITFFDISRELVKNRKTLDSVRLQILENLKSTTDTSTDNFNGLIDIEPINLQEADKVISIIRITIKKAEIAFLNIKREKELIWVSLTRRAHGQNVDVDIREYIELKK